MSDNLTITGDPTRSDCLTLIAISGLAYVVAVALHEHLGHTLMCILLGGHPKEVGAFYVNCDDAKVNSLGSRLVALAGPVVSLLTGSLSFLYLRNSNQKESNSFYFVWLLGSISLMAGTGYLLFSGISGIGDLGTVPGGVFFALSSEWVWRILLVLVGSAGYFLIIRMAVRQIDERIGGSGRGRITTARKLALTSYLTGGVIYLAIGSLNPHGSVIVVTSAIASSLGATSGLLWMMQLMDRHREIRSDALVIQRSKGWIAVAVVVTIVYGVVLGPTLRF